MKFLLFLLSLPLWAQPVVTSVDLEDLTHNSVLMRIASTPDGCYHVLYGVESGNLIYSSQSTGGAAAAGCYPTNSILLGGLAAGTTFYYRVQARDTILRDCDADPGNCSLSDEESFTTLAAPAHPVMPNPPDNWEPGCSIDESDYTDVPVAADGSNVCRATATVNSPHGWSVTNGDDFQTVLNSVGYKARIQITQSSVCNIPATVLGGSHGYVPRQKAVWSGASGINDPTHPYIIIETVPVNAADFPPCGARIAPSYAGKTATMLAVSQHTSHGNIFRWDTADGVGAHHYWIRNLRLALDRNATYTSPWMAMLAMGDESNASGSYNSPRYNILDRLIFIGDNPAPPVAPTRCTLEGMHIYARYFNIKGTYQYDVDCSNSNVNFAGVSIGIFLAEGASGPGTIKNNYVAAAGMGIYAENNTEGARLVDTAIEKNLIYQSWSWMYPFPERAINDWDGRYRVFRQPVEFKHGDRIKIDGNIIDGAFADQNEGPAILITAQSNNTIGSSGNQDYLITNNIIRRAANVVICASPRYGDPIPGPPDHRAFQRLLFANNLAYNLGRGKYQSARNLAGITDFYLLNHGCADVTVRNNTFGWKDQTPLSDLQYVTSFMTGASKGAFPAEGFTWKNNVHYYNSGNYRGVNTGSSNAVNAYPMVPQPINSPSGETDIKAVVDAYFGYLSGAAGVTTSYSWSGNVVICGESSSFGDTTMNPINQATCDSYHDGSPGTHPTGDIWVPGANMAARETASGLNTTTWRITPNAYNSGFAGANIDQIYASAGIVQNIVVMPTEAGARFSYLAPDSNTCAVDTSPNGTTWTRTTDAGGSRYRNTIVGSLSASTSYSWRLICYFDQLNTYDLWTASQLTTGTFTTTSAGTRVISVGFSLPSGATKVVVTAIPAGGATVTATCTTSPCELTLGKRGAYTLRKSYQNNSDVVLALSEIQNMETP